jgi:hypothetical protein
MLTSEDLLEGCDDNILFIRDVVPVINWIRGSSNGESSAVDSYKHCLLPIST